MTIRRPNLEGPGKVSPQGSFSHEMVNLLRQLVDAANASTAVTSTITPTTPETSPDGLQAQIDAIEAGLALMYGTEGITVVGSLESGLSIQGIGGADQQILASQIFGG